MQRSIALGRDVMRLLVTVVLLLFAIGAGAAASVNCTIAVSNVGVIAYVPTTAATNITQSTFTLTCVANNNGSRGTFTFEVGASGAAVTPVGGPVYSVQRNGSCSSAWGTSNAVNTIPITLTLVTKNVSVTSPVTSFWTCINGTQLGIASNTYTGTVSLTETSGISTLTPSPTTFTVSIFTPATCAINFPSGNTISLNYTSSGGAQSANAAVNATCTANLPYTVAVSPTSGTAVGIAYTLALSAASGTGSGGAQPYTITANAVGGQAGDCTAGGTVISTATGCKDTNSHTLTFTY